MKGWSPRVLWREHRRRLLWGALIFLVLALLSTLVILAGRYELEKLQQQVDRDASDAVSDLRVGLGRHLTVLESIIPRQTQAPAWVVQADSLLRERREWLRLEWRDPQMQRVAVANTPWRTTTAFKSGLDPASPELQLACSQARRWGNAAYAPSTYVVTDENAGMEVLQMCLPWSIDSTLGGYLIVSYSLPDLLSQLVSPHLSRSQQLSFVESDGTRLAMVGQMREGRRIFTGQQLLSLPGASLVLRVDSRRMGPDLFPNLLTAVVTVLSLTLLLVLALLGRDTRRRLRAEHELAERDRRRIERHLTEARLPPGKTLDGFDFAAVPMLSKAQVMAVAAGDAWLAQGANLLLFGPPGGGKSHLAAAIGLALVEAGFKVLFTRTTDLVQKLQVARRELGLEAAIGRLDRFDLLILDDLAYVTKDQAETSVLFELISARYERRSLMITANQPFGEWGRIFPDPAMTLAAVDRLVHHATIFEMNVESYRRRTALDRKRGPGRPPTRATIKTADV